MGLLFLVFVRLMLLVYCSSKSLVDGIQSVIQDVVRGVHSLSYSVRDCRADLYLKTAIFV